MRRRLSIKRLMALIVVMCVPLVGISATATAKVKGQKVGCHKTHTCKGATGVGSGTGGTPPTITVVADPNPLVETGASTVEAVIQVETDPSLAGDVVNIASSQLAAACGGSISFGSLQPGAIVSPDSIGVALDDDGNVTVRVSGTNCAPGPSVIDASLTVAPYYSAITTLTALPPNVTTAGVTGDPADEVETNDAGGVAPAYNSTPPGPGTTTGNVVSLGFQAYQAQELGNQITFAQTAPAIDNAVVTMSSWACENETAPGWYPHGLGGACDSTGFTSGTAYNAGGACEYTAPYCAGDTFTEPITLNVYNVGAGNSVGSLIFSDTQTFNIPYRPPTDNVDCTGAAAGDWYDPTSASCFSGLAANVTFTFPSIVVPQNVIWSVVYNTSQYGPSPYGALPCESTLQGCPYDSLNVGLNDISAPSVGSDPLPGTFYWNTSTLTDYCTPPLTPSFRLDTYGPNPDSCWSDGTNPVSPYNPYYVPAIQFNAALPGSQSDVYTIFTVETDPVYAEQTVEIDSAQLASRCGQGATWVSDDGSFTGSTADAVLDDDGNATFVFTGASCAAGDSAVIADVLAGSHPTYTTIYTIAAPQPTI
jgi:hypothetical protein